MTILPSEYSGTLVLRYEAPLLWRIAELVSLISVFALAVYVCNRLLLQRKT